MLPYEALKACSGNKIEVYKMEVGGVWFLSNV